MAVALVRAQKRPSGPPIYQVRIMDSAVARWGHAWYRDIDFWLYTGIGWARGRNAESGDWFS